MNGILSNTSQLISGVRSPLLLTSKLDHDSRQANEFVVNIQSSFYRSVNGIEQAPRSNLARLPTSSDQQFLDSICGGFTLLKESHALVFHEGHSTAAVHVQ